MLNKNFAATSAMIGRAPKMVIEQPHFTKQEDWGQVMSKFLTDYKNQTNENELKSALQSGDEEAINKAAAAYDPKGFYDAMQKIKAAREASDLDFERKKELANYNHALDMKKQEALYKLKGDLELINGGNGTAAQQNIAHLQGLGYSPEEAAMMVFGGQNPTLNLSSLGKKGVEAYDKKIGEDLAAQAIAQRQMRTLEPRAKAAIERAKSSLQEGSGLGQIGGIGWTTGQGGINRANVKNAQTQINTAMRGLLKEMGVGSTEMNSALEAEAYRYNIDPSTPIEQQEQVLKNFEEDYLSGKLADELKAIYGKKQQQTPIDPRILEAIKEGYSMDEINAFLGRK